MRFKIYSVTPCIYSEIIQRKEIMEAWYRKIFSFWATLFVCLFVCLFVSLSLCLSISLSLSVFLCLYLSLCLSGSLALWLSGSLAICLFVYSLSREDLGGGGGERVLPPGGQTITYSKFWENWVLGGGE